MHIEGAPTTLGGNAILFGDFRWVPTARTLTRGGRPVQVGARVHDILNALLERAGQVVSKAELLSIVWPNTFVDESALRVHMAALRRALGDGEAGKRLIVSVRGRGYTFVADTQQMSAPRDSSASRDRGHAPAPLVRVIGRDEVIQEAADHMKRTRFVTLTGTGGIGKTAVAHAIIEKFASTYRDGVQLVDLGSLSGPHLVAAHLASLLRLPAPDSQPQQHVIAHLRPQNKLIVFDNCEHAIDAVAGIAEAILQGAPEVSILATSRQPLGAMGEWVERLTPLALPPTSRKLTAAEVLRFAAVQLFVERSLDQCCHIRDADAPIVAEICTRLDGLPLAIELAAARVTLFGSRGLADRLDDRFRILTKGRRTALPRHQTLRATIDWSYETLDADERIVWSRLGVFPGVFTIEAADAIANARPRDRFNIVDILGSLVEKSLVSVDARDGEIRYRLLESLRLYTRDRLQETTEADLVRRRHAQYWHERSVASGDNWTETPNVEWLREHSGDIADVRAALDWAFGPGGDSILGIKIAVGTAPVWLKMLLLSELRRYMEHAIELAQGLKQIDQTLLMRLHLAYAQSIFHMPNMVREVNKALDDALAIADQSDDVNAQLQIIWTYWGQASAHGDYADLMPWLERVLSIRIKSSELPIGPLHERMAALTFHLLGEQRAALRHAQEAMKHAAVGQCTRQDDPFIYDHKIAASSHYSRILWLTGFPNKAMEIIRATVSDPLTADQPFAFGYFLVHAACPVSFWTANLEAVSEYLSILLNVELGTAASHWQRVGRFYERVLGFLQKAGNQNARGWDALVTDPSLTPFQADSLSTFDRRLLCAQSLARATDGVVNWCTAEVLRARGEALLTGGNADAWPEAEKLFLRAIDVSRGQGALSWDLRSATSLARLANLKGGVGDARKLLTEVYERFTEGYSTPDLVEAKAVLESLP